jgi:acetoin utilization deacetylase AcuC-like enzyme
LLQLVYSPRYHIDIGPHVFPTAKYRLVYERIAKSHPDALVIEPQPATWEELALVHSPEYLDKMRNGGFDAGELAALEIPWSPEAVEGFRLMTGGTLTAARAVMKPEQGSSPIVFHVGGGFHHAFANHGEGFCLFNDVAMAIRWLFESGAVRRAAVVDLDVHHGNGTAFIFERDPRVFTFSMHQQHNYPLHKPRGSLDIGLADGATDDTYLPELKRGLTAVFGFDPEIVFYLAGADPYEDDVLGGLALSKTGLRERDRRVLQACRTHGMPVVIVLAGGYARQVADTVDIHHATFVEAFPATAPDAGDARTKPDAPRVPEQ